MRLPDEDAEAGVRGGVAGLRHPDDREIARLAIPALGALIADPLLSLVDTAFVGQIGTDSLGALGAAGALFAISFFIFNFLEYGTTALVANAFGSGDLPRAGRATVTSLWIGALAGIGALALIELIAVPALRVIGAEGAVLDSALTYVRIRALAAPALLMIRVGHGAYRGYQNTRTPLFVSLGVNGVNLALDPVLIFVAGWGIAGAAWATVAAQWLGALWFGWLLLRRDRTTLGIDRAGEREAETGAFLVIGRDVAIRTAGLLGVLTLATAIAARVSETALAAHQVLYQLWIFLALLMDAFAVAAQAMVGRMLGAGKAAAARMAADRLLVLGQVVGLALMAILVAISPFVAAWFTDDPAVQGAIRSNYWFLVLGQPVFALVFVWDGVFFGAGDFWYLAKATLTAAAVAVAVLLLVLPLGWGLAGVWWGVTVLITGRALTLGWRRIDPNGPLAG